MKISSIQLKWNTWSWIGKSFKNLKHNWKKYTIYKIKAKTFLKVKTFKIKAWMRKIKCNNL